MWPYFYTMALQTLLNTFLFTSHWLLDWVVATGICSGQSVTAGPLRIASSDPTISCFFLLFHRHCNTCDSYLSDEMLKSMQVYTLGMCICWKIWIFSGSDDEHKFHSVQYCFIHENSEAIIYCNFILLLFYITLLKTFH